MPQRVFGIAVALTGVFLVLFLLLLRFDLQQAARKGPGWKRNLVLAGIFVLSSFGLISLTQGCDPPGPEQPRPTCYKVAMPVAPARASCQRLSQQLPLLEKMAESGKIQPEITGKVLINILDDIEVLEKESELSQLSDMERENAVELRKKVKNLLLNLEFLKVEMDNEKLRNHLCYMLVPVDREQEKKDKDGSDIHKQLELMRHFALRGKVTPAVSERVLQSLGNDLKNLQEG